MHWPSIVVDLVGAGEVPKFCGITLQHLEADTRPLASPQLVPQDKPATTVPDSLARYSLLDGGSFRACDRDVLRALSSGDLLALPFQLLVAVARHLVLQELEVVPGGELVA